MSAMATAILVDGAFFLRRFKQSFKELDAKNAEHLAVGVIWLAAYHIAVRMNSNPIWEQVASKKFKPEESPDLYRIFFYDCAPLTKRLHYPVTGKSLDLAKSDEAVLRNAIHDRLKGTRKVALRLGSLNEGLSGWKPRPDAVKKWLANPSAFNPTDDDFQIDVNSEGSRYALGS